MGKDYFFVMTQQGPWLACSEKKFQPSTLRISAFGLLGLIAEVNAK